MASLRRFGQQKPIVVDSKGVVRAGNGTLEAAKRLGWEVIDCVKTSLEGSDAIAYAIADNRTAELAEWDDDVLAAQLNGLLTESEEIALAAGWTAEEIEAMVALAEDDPEITEDDVPEPPVDPVTKPGDLWILGDHRLLCGDSTKAEDVERLMDGAKADLCFTSPPYGQQRDYTKEGKEKCKDWDQLMQGVFANLPMSDNGQVIVNLGLIHRDCEWIPYWDGWIEWMRSQGWRRFGWYVWDQGEGFPGDWNGRFSPAHEFIFHFNRTSIKPDKWVPTKNPGASFGTPGMKDKHGNRTSKSYADVIASTKIPCSVVRASRSSGVVNHPAAFSVEFASFFIKSWNGDIYEPFCGSGTTLIAAEQLGRKCYGMEISPQYCDVIVKRWETLTGNKAVLEQ